MKVLFLTRLYYPHIGGIEKHIEKISNILQQKGYEVVVLTTKYDHNLKDMEVYKSTKIVRFTQIGIKFIGMLSTWYWLLRNLSLFKESDIIHIHDVFIWYWPIKLLMPFKKVFLTIHGQWGSYPTSFRDKFQKKIGAYLSNGVISIGEYIPKNYGVRADTVSYGAVDLPKGEIKKSEVFLYVGRLDKDTGLPVFLEALDKLSKDRRISQIKPVFCGDGELKSKCTKYGQVKGWVDPGPYYAKSKYVYASGYLTILEALANKCLVFSAFSNPLQKDYYEMTPFRKYLVICKDSDDLYKRLYYVLKNSGEYKILSKEAYNWVSKETWQKMTLNYLDLWSK